MLRDQLDVIEGLLKATLTGGDGGKSLDTLTQLVAERSTAAVEATDRSTRSANPAWAVDRRARRGFSSVRIAGHSVQSPVFLGGI